MSFLKYRDKFFNRNKHESIKKRYVGQLKNVASCTDCRAWSSNPHIQRQYILDSFTHSSVDPNEFPAKISTDFIKLFTKRSNLRRRKRAALRRSVTDEKLYEFQQRNSNSFEEGRSRDDVLESANDPIEIKTSVNVDEEIDNLRNLVHDLSDQVFYLEDVKKENLMLRAKLNSSDRQQLITAEEEITYLCRKLDIYSDIEKRYDALMSDNNALKLQYNGLLKSLHELQKEKENLINELLKKNHELTERNSRALVVSNAIVDKKKLKDKLEARDDKIKFLLSIVEKQEFDLHDMTLEMQNLRANFSHKEEKLLRNMTQLKSELKQETTKVEKLENQLRATEELVRELESLRDQFRISNCTLAEHIHSYKRQFTTIRSASENMVTVIKKLQFDLNEKDKQIKKLSIYPQSSISIVYFSHLDYVLNSIENMEYPSEDLDKALTYMKHILKEIK
uniref:Uncharacterized protein n=1 Tax=Rhodnius prolixus TaxID=13249 RepID=T1I0R8_RHOPR